MSENGNDNPFLVSPKSGGSKTRSSGDKGRKHMTQLELTPVESLLFFNMIRFNGNRSKIDWDLVASHSNLKNATSAKVRFRQILKRHDLMDLVPKIPPSRPQGRKAVLKAESLDDDEDGKSSYNRGPVVAETGIRHRVSRTRSGRAKRREPHVKSGDEQDSEEAAVHNIAAPPALAPQIDPYTKIKKSNTESEPDSDSMLLLKHSVVAGGIEGTDSASPQEFSCGKVPRGFGAGGAHHIATGYHEVALPANTSDPQMMQIQLHHAGISPSLIYGPHFFASDQPFNLYTRAPCFPAAAAADGPRGVVATSAHGGGSCAANQSFAYSDPLLGIDMPGENVPFGHMTHGRFNEQYKAGTIDGGEPFFDHA